MRPAQILEERLFLRIFLSTTPLWESLLMDKGLSIVRRISTNSEQPNTFTNASIFPDKKTSSTWRNELIFDYFLTAIEGKEQKLPNSCVYNAPAKACYSWVFRRNWVSDGLGGSALTLSAKVSGYHTRYIQSRGKIMVGGKKTTISKAVCLRGNYKV